MVGGVERDRVILCSLFSELKSNLVVSMLNTQLKPSAANIIGV